MARSVSAYAEARASRCWQNSTYRAHKSRGGKGRGRRDHQPRGRRDGRGAVHVRHEMRARERSRVSAHTVSTYRQPRSGQKRVADAARGRQRGRAYAARGRESDGQRRSCSPHHRSGIARQSVQLQMPRSIPFPPFVAKAAVSLNVWPQKPHRSKSEKNPFFQILLAKRVFSITSPFFFLQKKSCWPFNVRVLLRGAWPQRRGGSAAEGQVMALGPACCVRATLGSRTRRRAYAAQLAAMSRKLSAALLMLQTVQLSVVYVCVCVCVSERE